MHRGLTLNREMSIDMAPRCETPLALSWLPPPSMARGAVRLVRTKHPCRKCKGCLRIRRATWVRRMEAEALRSERTWFVTFTFAPGEMAKVIAAASLDRGDRSPDARRDEWSALVAASGAYLTRFWKRVRRNAAIRYVAVAEPHKTGLPHWHALVFCSKDLGRRALEGEWPHGHIASRLTADGAAIRYIAKYIGKDANCRIRASQGLGRLTLPPKR